MDALASALRLSAGEHARLRSLAGFAGQTGTTMGGDLSARAQDGLGALDGVVSREITPAARRMLDRLTEVPACVCDASWTVLGGNRRWEAAGCPAGAAHGRGRNMAWRIFTDAPTDILRTEEHQAAFRAALVTDLRIAFRDYPADPQMLP